MVRTSPPRELAVRTLVCLAFFGCASLAAAQVRELALPASDLIFDAARQRIYASVPSRAGGSLGNTITVISPATGQLGPSVFVGSEPGRLALSDDGSAFYVALGGAAAIRRVDLASLTPGLQFTLGSDPSFGPYSAEDIEVLPGLPSSVAVSRRYSGLSPRHAGVAIYDNGVMRPMTTAGHTGSNVIEAAGTPPERLYGLNTESTEFGFRRMDVSPSGVTVLEATPGLFDRFDVDMEFDAGRVYVSSGEVIDPELRQLLGTFVLPSGPGGVGPASVRPAADIGRVFFAQGDMLYTFNAATFVPQGATQIPGVQGFPRSLIRAGTNALAFRTTEDQIFLVGTAPAPAAPTLTLTLTGCSTACRSGDLFIVSATITNPSAQPIRVEVKAGVVIPGGATQNIWATGNAHYEATLPPGLNISVELLRATLPTGLVQGDWIYEATLLTPDLGHIVARDAESFRVVP